jgi:protein-tyrosine phosphatase
MIDTHLHILPGVDDGPATEEEAIILARALVQEGVHTAIATPHYNDEFPRMNAMEVRKRVYALQQTLDQLTIPLRLFAGHEALIKPGLVEDIQVGRLATLNGSRYLLLELWNTGWVPATERTIFELMAFGITPVIAHPERYAIFQKDPQALAGLCHRGIVTQITASSLIGMQGKTAQRTAETLLQKGLVHYIASDAHGLSRRPPAIAQGLRRAVQLLGQASVYRLTEMNPAAILSVGAVSR